MSKRALRKGFTLVEVLVAVAVLSLLLAIALPNDLKFQGRSKVSEVRLNLRAVYEAQRAYFAEREAYTEDLAKLGFQPEGGNRFKYTAGAGAATCWTRPGLAPARYNCIDKDTVRFGRRNYTFVTGLAPTTVTGNAPTRGAAGVFGTCPNCGFNVQAVGNLDNDITADSWFISSGEGVHRTKTSACRPDNRLTAGTPFNTYSDLCD